MRQFQGRLEPHGQAQNSRSFLHPPANTAYRSRTIPYRQFSLRRNYHRKRVQIRNVPVKHIHLVHTHRRNRPQNILHGEEIPRRIKHNASVREDRRIPNLHSDRHARRISPNQLRERLQASNLGPRRRGGEIRRTGGGDFERVRLVDAVVERSGKIGDGDG